jgi:YMGG-like Gly-zipper/Glycine-zipper domain
MKNLLKPSHIATLTLGITLALTYTLPSQAWNGENHAVKTVVKQAAVGAGIGAATGYISKESSIGRGAGIGAITGAGTGLIDSSSTLRNRPLIKDTAKGAVIGTGASAVLRNNKLKGAAIGAGSGAGWHFVKKVFN